MVTTQTTIGWDKGRFAVERRCTCKCCGDSFIRITQCTNPWGMVASSDDAGDAIGESGRLAVDTGVAHRVVDTQTGKVWGY